MTTTLRKIYPMPITHPTMTRKQDMSVCEESQTGGVEAEVDLKTEELSLYLVA